MTRRVKTSRSALDAAAEVVGRTVGQVVNTVDVVKSRHPDPVAEFREALIAGQEKLTGLASRAMEESAVIGEKASAVVERTRKAIKRSQRKGARLVSTVKRMKKKVVKRAKRAVRIPKTIVEESSRRLAPRKSSRRKSPKRRTTTRKPAKPKAQSSPGVAITRRLQTTNVKRRQAHISSQGRVRQARRDKRR